MSRSPSTPRAKSRTAGFTLAEIILVVGVLAILVSITAQPVIEFMKQRDVQTEQNTLNEISKAMKSYLADRNVLPADNSATWANDLAAYTNLSANQIATDSWGNPRTYVRHVVVTTFLGTPVDIYYATVHSMGPNREADGGAASAGGDPVNNSGIAVTSSTKEFANLTDTGWWKNKADDNTRLNFFVTAQPAMDDQMMRMTDYSEKIEKYNTSLLRLERISEALETYSKTKYNEQAIVCSTTSPPPTECATAPERFIYYPRSNDSGNLNTYYTDSIRTDLTTYNTGLPIDNSDNHATRRTHMINLMRILGLPDEYCCNALEVITGTRNEMPFYYFSNPRPRNGSGGCSARPNPQGTGAASRTLPARLTIRGNTAVPGTCG